MRERGKISLPFLILKNMNKVTIEREATKEEQEVINKMIELANSVGLELIGTRPRDRG